MIKPAIAAVLLIMLGALGGSAAHAGPDDPCWSGCSVPPDPHNPPRMYPEDIDRSGALPPDPHQDRTPPAHLYNRP